MSYEAQRDLGVGSLDHNICSGRLDRKDSRLQSSMD